MVHKQAVDFGFEEIDPVMRFEKDDDFERFGRYPHRNAILGRESLPEEQEFLLQPGSSF